MSDAEATVRAAILEAVASTAHLTQLTAGPEVEEMIDAIVRNLKRPETAWAPRELFA